MTLLSKILDPQSQCYNHALTLSLGSNLGGLVQGKGKESEVVITVDNLSAVTIAMEVFLKEETTTGSLLRSRA